MLTATIIKSLQVYGIAIVVSLIVALLIKVLVVLTARLEKSRSAEVSAVPTGTVCPVGFGVPEEDVAALSAAIFAAIGPHRVLHIAQATHGWASGARAAQHSHTPGSSGRGHR